MHSHDNLHLTNSIKTMPNYNLLSFPHTNGRPVFAIGVGTSGPTPGSLATNAPRGRNPQSMKNEQNLSATSSPLPIPTPQPQKGSILMSRPNGGHSNGGHPSPGHPNGGLPNGAGGSGVAEHVSVPKDVVETCLKNGNAWIVTETEKRTRSDVWKYFGRVQLADGRICRDVVGCMGCLMVYMYRSKSQGTSTLRHHKCPYVFQVLQAELVSTSISSSGSPSTLTSLQPIVVGSRKRILLEGGSGGNTPDGRREMTPEADIDRKPVMPTPPPLKEHLMSSPPPQHQHHPLGPMPPLSTGGRGGGGGGHNHLGTPPPPVSTSSSLQHHHPSSLVGGGSGGRGGGNGGDRGGSDRCSTPVSNHNNHIHSSSGSSASPPQQLLCVRWGNFDSNIVSMFTKLRSAEHFVDATLWCEGKTIKCHKMILSACSTYFEKLLTENPNPHPIIFLKDMRFWEITALVEFMYKGEVSIHQEKLQSLLRAAESLQIKGLGSPSANDGPGGIGAGAEAREERERHVSGMDEDLSMDMSSSTTTATPNNNTNPLHSSSSASSHPNSFSNHLINSFNSSRGSPSLLHMNMGMDLSQGARSSGSGGDLTPLSLSLSSSLKLSSNNPAKRRKKDNPRRLDILPPRAALPIPVFNSTNMMGAGGGGVDRDSLLHHGGGGGGGGDEEYDAEPPSDDEMTIHEPVQQRERPSIENFKQEPESLLHHHIQLMNQVGKMQQLQQAQQAQAPSSYEEDEDEGDGHENYGDHADHHGAGLQMDETKSESEGEGGDCGPGESQDNDDDLAGDPGDHDQQQNEEEEEQTPGQESEQGFDEETDESGAISLRVASAAERERLERDRSRKGNPIKKIIVGNINNNNNNESAPTLFHSPTSAAE